MLDHLKDDLFSTTSLTEAINVVPNKYGRIQELGLFRVKGMTTTTATIEINNGVLSLIPTSDRAGPAGTAPRGRRKLKSFSAFHLEEKETITADAVQNVRKFGSDDELEGVQEVVNTRLEELADRHYITWEHLRVGALKGEILDADGSVLLNLYDEFDIAEPVFAFDFAGAPDPAASTRAIKRHMEKMLRGDVMSGVHAFCSPTWFDNLLADENVKRAYDRQQSAANPHRDDVRKGFKFQDCIFEEYNGSASYRLPNGDYAERDFIPDGEARFFPIGTRATFVHYNAPGTTLAAANTIGEPMYASQYWLPHDTGVEIRSESNPLPLCLRPELLVRGTS